MKFVHKKLKHVTKPTNPEEAKKQANDNANNVAQKTADTPGTPWNKDEQTEDDKLNNELNKYRTADGDLDAEGQKLLSQNSAQTPYGTPKGITNFDDDGNLDFFLPQYGVQNFINERALWEKGIHNITGEPGWFYFKIFFHFNTNHGLFGNIFNMETANYKMTDEEQNARTQLKQIADEAYDNKEITNGALNEYDNMLYNKKFFETFKNSTSALRYLFGIRKHYKYSLIPHRILALYKFAFLLSYINVKSPWFFSGISNLSKLNSTNANEIAKERSIDLICNGDAIDMRLDQLLEYYKYATYDNINFREVIPENLRKFDMDIFIMNAPIKYFQTGMFTAAQNAQLSQIGSNGSTVINKVIAGINKISSWISGNNVTYFDYKTINGKSNGPQDRLTFDMYSLKNCEIDPASYEGYLPNSISNQQFFRMGNGAIKIKFDRVYKHTFNEWSQMMLGDDGFYYDGNLDLYSGKLTEDVKPELESAINEASAKDIQNTRIEAIKNSIYNTFFNKDATAYKSLIDFSESIIEDSLINTSDPRYMGNIGYNYNENDIVDRFNNIGNQIKNFFTW